MTRHGTGVVALGLKVDNTYACTNRADFLGIPVVKPGQAGAIPHNAQQDEDKTGVSSQFYTIPIDGKFSFEIVQRNGYKGLGSANAALRAAAQQYSINSKE
ncbi:MAG: 4-hydroxyphenylpyruvate dioxygenase-like putative hemolysin [Granulosicoccus sp.]|jgi:4-hydroxyphenylpyruvate dioxygenase-like putative hemolysin